MLSLANQAKKEEVSISFHYLVRERVDGESTLEIPFTDDEFVLILQHLKALKRCDFNDEEIRNKIRNRRLAPIQRVEDIEDNYICGTYKGSYWGHAYENDRLGLIPWDSINLRPFFFILYKSKSGKIYIGSQYLGNFGGYSAIKATIVSAMENSSEITAHSFNVGNVGIGDAKPKSVEIQYSKNGRSITSRNSIGKSLVLTIKKQDRDDDFEEKIQASILSKAGAPRGEMRKILSQFCKENKLLEIEDDEIENCKIVAGLNQSTKTYYLIDGSNFASRFPISIPYQADGHPQYEPLKRKAKEVLKKQILSKKEND